MPKSTQNHTQMTREELILELNNYLGENVVSTTLYFVLENEAELTIKKVDVENTIQDRMTALFQDYVIPKFTDNVELSYIPLSSFDDRKNVAFRYDYEIVPGRLNFMDTILTNPPRTKFNFRTDDMTNLFGYLMVVGNETNKLSVFRRHHPIDLVRRDRRLYLIKSNERFVTMNNDGFILDKGFDFMKISTDLVVIKPKVLEKDFGFDEIIEAAAEEGLSAIDQKNFVDDMIGFRIFADSNRPFQRKLVKAKTSPVLNVPFSRVAQFVSNNESLSSKLRLNSDSTKFNLNSAASKKLFLKLLNDDYLNSPLTEIHYDSRAKDILE